LNVLVHGSLGDVENFADFPSRFAIRDPSQDLTLASGQFAFVDLSSGQKRTPVFDGISIG
jgi:hypothetical protein